MITDNATIGYYPKEILVDCSVLSKNITITLPEPQQNSTNDNYIPLSLNIAKVDKTDFDVIIQVPTGMTMNNGTTDTTYVIDSQNYLAKIFIDTATTYRRL